MVVGPRQKHRRQRREDKRRQREAKYTEAANLAAATRSVDGGMVVHGWVGNKIVYTSKVLKPDAHNYAASLKQRWLRKMCKRLAATPK